MRDIRAKDRIIVALDVDTVDDALSIVSELKDSVGMYKVGLQLITRNGPETFFTLRQAFPGIRFFYDAKFNDIPNTVGAAARNASMLPGVRFMSVHASAGHDAMWAAAREADPVGVLAITALTSLTDLESGMIFGLKPLDAIPSGREWAVEKLALMAQKGGVEGIVCSPKELVMLKSKGIAEDLVKVVPGIRPQWSSSNDQKAFDTPAAALRNGADFLVIGRPITQPPSEIGSRSAAVLAITAEMELATKN